MANKNESIEMQNIELDENMEIGGARRIDISNLSKASKFKVISAEAIETKWGSRVDFTIQDEYDNFILSSWNIQTTKKLKVGEILNKYVMLAQTSNPKKVSLVVLAD